MKYWLIIGMFLLITTYAQAQTIHNNWKGITPLHSTRSDVENLLGQPTKREFNLYETESEKIVIWYSKQSCKENSSVTWNVPKDTVLGILVSPKHFLGLDALFGTSLNLFTKVEDREIKDVYIYQNKDGSIKFQTKLLPNGSEDVVFVSYAPSEQDIDLRCKKRQKKKN